MNDRYEIIRKLGNGSNRFVVLKIGVSKNGNHAYLAIQRDLASKAAEDSDSRYVVALLDSFIQEGPNGHHPCSVLEPMGPSVSSILNAPRKILDLRNMQPRRFSTQKTKAILRDVLCGLRFLHSNDIVHGDLQSGNVLFSVRDLNLISVDDLRQDINSSRIEYLKRKDGKIDKWAPKYLIVAMPLNDYVRPDEEQHVKIIDLESAFLESEPPPRIVTPVALRAPETILGGPVSRSIDIWSLGCLLFELLTGMPLFQLAVVGNADEALDDDYMIQLAEVLSPLPESITSKWPRAGQYFGPNGERLDAAVGKSKEDSLHSDDDLDEEEEEEDDFDDDEVEFPTGGFGPPLPCDPLEKLFGDNKPQDVNGDEEKTILSLLRWMLQYEVSERPTVDQVLDHAWFET
ncbi:hypothetical protein ACHAQF_001549 [Verticillium nonalfalfae]